MNWSKKITEYRQKADEIFDHHLKILGRQGNLFARIDDGCPHPNYEIVRR